MDLKKSIKLLKAGLYNLEINLEICWEQQNSAGEQIENQDDFLLATKTQISSKHTLNFKGSSHRLSHLYIPFLFSMSHERNLPLILMDHFVFIDTFLKQKVCKPFVPKHQLENLKQPVKETNRIIELSLVLPSPLSSIPADF